jgi:hypothetical protein
MGGEGSIPPEEFMRHLLVSSVLFVLALSPSPTRADDRSPGRGSLNYEISVTNATRNQRFTPPGGGAQAQGDEEGVVHIHAGIHGIGDLDESERDWRNPAAIISIRRVR